MQLRMQSDIAANVVAFWRCGMHLSLHQAVNA